MAEANLRERLKEAAAAEALVEREVREFLDWQKARDAVPLLNELRRRAEEIRRARARKAEAAPRARSPPEQEEALEAATTAIVNKLLHPPTVHLKEAAPRDHAPEQLSLIRKLLGL